MLCRDCRDSEVTIGQRLCEDCEAIQGWEIREHYFELEMFHVVAIALGVSVLFLSALVAVVG